MNFMKLWSLLTQMMTWRLSAAWMTGGLLHERMTGWVRLPEWQVWS